MNFSAVSNFTPYGKKYESYDELVRDGKKIIELSKEIEVSKGIIKNVQEEREISQKKIEQLTKEKENNNEKINNNNIKINNNDIKIKNIDTKINNNDIKINENDEKLNQLKRMREIALQRKREIEKK